MSQPTIIAHQASFHRKSKRTSGQHPVPCPAPAIGNGPAVVRRRRRRLVVVQS